MNNEDKKAPVTMEVLHAAIENLGRMINAGFAGVTTDLLALTERVDTIEKELRGMHQNFDMTFLEKIGMRR